MFPRRLLYASLFLASLLAVIALPKNLGVQDIFSFPPLAQSGRPYVITGPFDGDSSNTKIEVGGTGIPVTTETTRGATIEIPSTLVGPTNITVSDRSNSASGSFRALKIDLTAPK